MFIVAESKAPYAAHQLQAVRERWSLVLDKETPAIRENHRGKTEETTNPVWLADNATGENYAITVGGEPRLPTRRAAMGRLWKYGPGSAAGSFGAAVGMSGAVYT